MHDYGYIIVGSEGRDTDFSEEDGKKCVLREIDLGNNRTIYDERDRLLCMRDGSLFLHIRLGLQYGEDGRYHRNGGRKMPVGRVTVNFYEVKLKVYVNNHCAFCRNLL